MNKLNLLRSYRLPVSKIHVIPNGFDADDFQRVNAENDPPPQFTVSCLGQFHDMPDTRVFFCAFRRLSDLYGEVRLQMFGWYSRNIRQALKSELRPGTWELHSRIEHREAIRVMQNSAVLLANLPGPAAAHWIPGKLYDYLAARRPILLIGPPQGEAAEIVYRTRSGMVSDFDEQSIFAALNDLHGSWRRNFRDFAPRSAEIARFDRRAQTKQLADIFNMLTCGAGSQAAQLQAQGS